MIEILILGIAAGFFYQLRWSCWMYEV